MISRPGRIAIDLTFALMLFSGAIATISQRILMYLIIALTIAEFTADLIVEFDPLLIHWDWDSALKVSGLAILVVMTLKQTFRSGSVTVHRVMGGVAAYLLIGVTWASDTNCFWKEFQMRSTSNRPSQREFPQVNRPV